jgi:site-specific recombinase XerD
VRTVPIPTWVKSTVDAWATAASITHGPVFRAIKAWRVWGDGMSRKVLWDVVRAAAARAGIDKLAPHDLRRTWARLCHVAGGELEQIQFLLGHVSIQTTERYLGCK